MSVKRGLAARAICAPTEADRARFNSRVSDADPVTGCRAWLGYCNPKGYGQFNMEDRTLTAPRVAATWAWGVLPEGTEPDHLCGNRACVEVSHLELVTPEVNLWRQHGFHWGSDCWEVLRRLLAHPNELFTCAESSELLGLGGRCVVHRAIQRGELHSVDHAVGHRTYRRKRPRITKSELARFIIRRGYEDAGLGALRAFANHVDPQPANEG